MLSKTQYLEKNKVKFDSKNLTKTERNKRYRDYSLSYSMTTGNTGAKVVKTSKRSDQYELTFSKLSDCTKHYAVALADPFGVRPGVCIPDLITLPSYKVSFFVRATFATGVSGYGFVAFTPHTMAINDLPCVTRSTTSYDDQLYNLFPGGGKTSNTYSNSPFTAVQFSNASSSNSYMRKRLVAAGVKVRYIGPELTRSGRVIEYRHPTNGNLTQASEAQLLANRETTPVPVEREWHYVNYRPAVPEDLAYVDQNPIGISTGVYSEIILVAGAPPGSLFEFEAITHFELVGVGVPELTTSHSDVLGMSAVQAALPNVQASLPPQLGVKDIVKKIGQAAGQTLSFIGPMLGLPELSGVGSAVTGITNYLL